MASVFISNNQHNVGAPPPPPPHPYGYGGGGNPHPYGYGGGPPPQHPPPPAAYYTPPRGVSPLHMQGAGAPVPWTTSLCNCGDDISNCCITCFCPCITFGQNVEILDKGTSSCGACCAAYGLLCALGHWQCFCSCVYRTKMRQQYNLAGDSCSDFWVHWCCGPCALCQEYRELKNRGLDPSIGWAGNVQRQAPAGVPVPPPVQGGMSRY